MALVRGRPGRVAHHISSQAQRCLSPVCIPRHLGVGVSQPCSCVSFSTSTATSTSILETSTARSELGAVATARSAGGNIISSPGAHTLFFSNSDPSRDLFHAPDERPSGLGGLKGIVFDNAIASAVDESVATLCSVESGGTPREASGINGEGTGDRWRRKALLISSSHPPGPATVPEFSSPHVGAGTITGVSRISGLTSFSVPSRGQQHQQRKGLDDIERRIRSCGRQRIGGWQGGGVDQKRFFATQPKNPPKQHLRYIHRVKPAESTEEEQSVVDGMHPSSIGNRLAVMEGAHWGKNRGGDEAESVTDASKKSSEMTRKWLKGFKAEDILKDKSLLRQQLEVRGDCTVDEAITMFVNQRATSFIVVNRRKEVIGMFTSRDLLSELARYPNKADGLKTKAHKFMIPLSRMIYCSMKDSLYQCLLVMSELKVRNLPVVSEGKVMGIVNVNDISDFSFSMEELGGKKAYMKNISERKGLPKGVGLDPKQNRTGWKQTFSASVGTVALPHPHKLPDGGVSASQREHRHLEIADDPTLSEDSHFVLDVAWPTDTTDTVNYVGIADGVGSWKRVGVDPRDFSQRLMHWAREYILSMAPGSGIDGHGHLSPRPPKPHEVLMAAWEYTIGEKVVGSSTACIAALDYDLEQLTFSNIGDCGVVVLRHIDSNVAGYMREKQTPRHLRNSDLRLAFISQQQLRSFNLPYQFGYTNVPEDNANFETPRDAVNTSFPVRPGDIIILATDGLFDNMELDDICATALEWEYKWFGGELMGLGEHNNAAMRDLASQLGHRARELSLDKTRDSPFALLAKENDVMWGGGMPDDITVVALRVINKVDSRAAAVSTKGLGADDDQDEAAA